jgi:MFS family permease
MAFPATLSLISNVFTERRERARAIGLWGAIAGVAIAMGPIVRGWLLEQFSWASIFIAMAPVAAAAAILVALVVPTSKDPEAAAPDIAGLVLSSATMTLLVFTIIEAPAYGWAAARSLAGFAASAVLLAAFIVRERRAAHPMLDVRLFRNLRFSAASGAVTVSFFTLFGFIFLMTQYFQFVRGYGPLSVGAWSIAGTQLAVRAGTKLIVTVNGPQTWQLTEETTVKRIRIDRPRIRREQPWPEDLLPDPRDPDVVRAKALARSQLTGSSRSNRTQ